VLSDADLAELARMSFRASRAPSDVLDAAAADIAAWLAGEPQTGGGSGPGGPFGE
jgi:adenosine deaminase